MEESTYFIRLTKFTPDFNFENFADERVESRKAATKLGIKVHGAFITLGRYDLVTILEAKDEKSILNFHKASTQAGGRITETLVAISADEFEDIMKE